MKISTDQKKIEELLMRGVREIIERPHVEKLLSSGKPLRIKFGIDPTGPVLHLGHAVVLRLLRRFQDLGHTVIFLVGDFTATIGDPTGRTEARPPLSKSEIDINMVTYVAQAGKILDMKKVEVRYNREWYDKMTMFDLLVLSSTVTYGQVVARRDFRKRLAADEDFTLTEFIYPVLQGYDSVMLHADVEVGGSDQLFNMLMGRRIQKRHDQKPQDVMAVVLLEGLDGVEKMSKTSGNYIALQEEPESMYGKLMSMPDVLIGRYFELCTDVSMQEIKKIEQDMKRGANPRDLKARLAHTIVTMYHSKKAADAAVVQFDKMFRSHEAPEDMQTLKVKKAEWNIVDLLVETKLAASKSEARRLIEQGGIKVGGEVEKSLDAAVEIPKDGVVLQRGKRHFVNVKR